MKGISCPIGSHPVEESSEWQFMVAEHQGNKVEAYRAWELNGKEYPDSILSKVADHINITKDGKESNYVADPYLDKKTKLLEDSAAIITQKINKLSSIAKATGDKMLTKQVKELQQLLKDNDIMNTEAALNNFVKTADRMSQNAEQWMNNMQAGTAKADLGTIKKMQEAVESLDMIKEIRAEYFSKS